MKLTHGIAASLLVTVGSAAWAAPKSVTLDVPGMTCPTCPVTIKKALLKQPGVTAVIVRYEKKQLEVAFDDAKTNPTAIMKSRLQWVFRLSQPSEIAFWQWTSNINHAAARSRQLSVQVKRKSRH
jgi:periplasmic mercuric ion binding protein